jgi:hypothetical protein
MALLIAASFLTTGGWFCADGRACLPAFSPTCCCGSESTQAAAMEADRFSTPEAAACLSEGCCGCYRDLPSLAARPAVVVTTVPALLPLPGIATPEPPALCVSRRPSSITPSPPRYLLAPTHLRAPPAA